MYYKKIEGYCNPYKNETLEVFNLKLQKKTHKLLTDTN